MLMRLAVRKKHLALYPSCYSISTIAVLLIHRCAMIIWWFPPSNAIVTKGTALITISSGSIITNMLIWRIFQKW